MKNEKHDTVAYFVNKSRPKSRHRKFHIQSWDWVLSVFFPHIVAAAWMQDHLRCMNTCSKLCVFSCLCQKCCIATPYKKPPQYYYCGRNIADTPQHFYITSPSESVVDILKCGGEVYLRTLLQLCLSSFDCKGQGDDYIYMITSDLRCNRGGFHKGLAC